MTPIFLLVGAPAVGKSTTAHALAAHFPKSIHIPVDDIRHMVVSGVFHPSNDWSQPLIEQLALARYTVAEMALRYQMAGFVVTIDDFWDPFSQLQEYGRLLEHPHIHKILLYPTAQAAKERNQKRAGANDTTYIDGGIQTVYAQLEHDATHLAQQGWVVVDTTEMDVAATVNHILVQQ